MHLDFLDAQLNTIARWQQIKGYALMTTSELKDATLKAAKTDGNETQLLALESAYKADCEKLEASSFKEFFNGIGLLAPGEKIAWAVQAFKESLARVNKTTPLP